MSFFASEADSPWFGGGFDPAASFPLGVPPAIPASGLFSPPERSPSMANKPPDDQVAIACQGFPAGCQSGGSYGTTALYSINGKPLCRDCAVKILGIGGLPGPEQQDFLKPFLIGGPGK